MAVNQLYDFCRNVTTTTGTGTLTLGAAVTGYRSMTSVLANADTTYYSAFGVDAYGNPSGEWEVGLGTYTTSGTTLARTTVLASSNANAAVSFSAGTKHVCIVAPATVLQFLARVSNQRLHGRNTAGSGLVEEVTASQVLDWLGSTRGQVLYRGSTGWAALDPGTSGQALLTGGAGADPSWGTPAASLPVLNTLTAADAGLTDAVAEYNAAAAANRTVTVERILGLARLHPGGRLTLTSGVPVTTTDVTGASTIYYNPFLSDMAWLHDGTRWRARQFVAPSLTLSGLTSGKLYDVFGYDAGDAAAAAVRNTSVGTVSGGTAVTLPTGRQSGDLLLVFATGSLLPLAGTGWVRQFSQTDPGLSLAMALYTKTSDGTDSASPFNTSATAAYTCYAVSNGTLDVATPTSGTGASITAPTVTAANSGVLISAYMRSSGTGSITPPGGQTPTTQTADPSGSDMIRTGYETLSAAGATGTRAATNSSSTNWVAANVVVKSAATGLQLELSAAWTNDTTRATTVTIQDGRYCKNGDKTRLHLGTIRATGTTTTEDSAANRNVFNLYNEVARATTGASRVWFGGYGSPTWPQSDAASDTVAGRIQVAAQADLEAATSTTLAVTPGRAQYHPGVAKAWVHFTVSGTTVTVVASYNVSSVTRNGAGDYTVNFTTAFSGASAYTMAGCPGLNTAATAILTASFSNLASPAAGSCRVATLKSDGTFDDVKRCGLAFYGDQ